MSTSFSFRIARPMMALHCIVTTAAVLLAASATAQPAGQTDRAPQRVLPQATTDPLKVIYRVSGIRDDGAGDNTGTATVFHCSNLSNVSENVRFAIHNSIGSLVANSTRTIPSKSTISVATHGTANSENLPHLSPGTVIGQGLAVIAATSPKVICTVIVVDAAAATPIGTPLHLVRFTPMKDTLE